MKIDIRYKVAALLPALAFMTGCSDEEIVKPGSIAGDSSIPVTLSATYPMASRASDAGFEPGDMMGVYLLDYEGDAPQDIAGGDIHAGNVRFEFNGSDNSWRGATDLYWKDRSTPADLIAYYPFVSTVAAPTVMPHLIARRQDTAGTETQPGGYETSDLLWGAVRRQMPTAERVDLTLNHLMAGVRVTLKEGSGFAAGEWASLQKNVLVANVVPSGTVNLADGSVAVGSDDAISVVPMEYNGDYRAVIFPQTVAAGKELIAISVGSEGYSLSRQQSVSYESGKMHTFTVTVDRREDGALSFSLTDEAILPWMDEAEFRDGIMRIYTIIDVPEKGTLEQIMIDAGVSYAEIQNLKLTGEINEVDYGFMRDKMTSLKSLNLKDVNTFDGERVEVIPIGALSEKTTLMRIVFPEKLKEICCGAFYATGLVGDLLIPNGVTIIGDEFNAQGAFGDCKNLKGKLTLPSTLVSVGFGTFSGSMLSGTLELPGSLKYIGDRAFGAAFSSELILPESLEYIGENAFSGFLWGNNNFSGSLEIPQMIKTIGKDAFDSAGFTGNLILPEGLTAIYSGAFRNCGFGGELVLPSTLSIIGEKAFMGNRFNGIVFNDGIVAMGAGCFANCKYLSGRLEIPRNVTRINEYTFANASALSEVELHENVTYVGAASFAGCNSLTEITISNPIPPITSVDNSEKWYELGYENIDKDPFYGTFLGDVTLKVPPESRDAYSRAPVWKNIGRIAVYNDFVCRPNSMCALNSSHEESIIVDGNGEWEVTHLPSWCSISKTSGTGKTQISLTINEMPKGSGDRRDYVEFTLKGTEFTARCDVEQRDYQYGEDECVTLQRASRGDGIDVLFIGDGFDAEAIASGKYLDRVNEQMEYFFGVEPYTTYRDYFNVYACISLSQETGVNTTATRYNTRFMTRFDNGTGCSVKGLACDDPNAVFDYATSHSPLTRERMGQSLIIMSLNSDEYGSVTTLTDRGAAIAIVGASSDPYPMDSRGILQHEACGHAFGKLAEERITQSRYIKDKEKYEIETKQQWYGWYQNISLSGKPAEVAWADMIFDPRYSNKVDVYEGAYGVTRGVFRAEINSCMNYGIPYFSAPARLDIVRRILEYSGEGFTMEKFLERDNDRWGATGDSRAAAGDLYGGASHHHPVRIVKSKKY